MHIYLAMDSYWIILSRKSLAVFFGLTISAGQLGCALQTVEKFDDDAQHQSADATQTCQDAAVSFREQLDARVEFSVEHWCTIAAAPLSENELKERASFLPRALEAIERFEWISQTSIGDLVDVIIFGPKVGQVVFQEDLNWQRTLVIGPTAITPPATGVWLHIPEQPVGIGNYDILYIDDEQTALNYFFIRELVHAYDVAEGFGPDFAVAMGYTCSNTWDDWKFWQWNRCFDNPQSGPTQGARVASHYRNDLGDTVSCYALDLGPCKDRLSAARIAWIENQTWFPQLIPIENYPGISKPCLSI